MLTPSMLLPEDGICELEIISVGSKPLAPLLSQTMSPSSPAKFSLYIFIHSNGGPWSEASWGFQSEFGDAVTDSRCLIHWLRTPTRLFTFISFEGCRYSPFAGNIKRVSKERTGTGGWRLQVACLTSQLIEKQPCS